MSFILDALRKSEHERQRSAVPALSHVPLATPRHEPPRWALVLIGVLGAAVLVLGGAWLQSTREPSAEPPAVARSERPLELPAPRSPAVAASPATPTDGPRERPPVAAGSLAPPAATLADAASPPAEPVATPIANGEPTLPSAAALAAQGIALPTLRLELHAYSERPSDRFVFINGRKYSEGERLSEGPELVSIAPNGVVLSHLGQRFLLSPE